MSNTKVRRASNNRFPIGEGFEFTGHRDTRWCVGRQIGEGTFSYVFELRRVDKDKRVAIKFAKLPRGRPERAATRAALFAEFEKIRLIAPLVNNGEHPMISSAYEFGEVLVPFDGEESVKCAFVIMPLLGPSLSDIRKQGNVLSAACVCKLSERVLQCLRALHSNGFLHLDEKPSNWVVPLPKSRSALSSHSELLELISRTLLIDLGNSRHLDPPPLSDTNNPNAGLVSISSEFLGSSRHTSSHTDLGAHAQQGYGRRDDLLSWWNAVLSLLSDQVPPWHFFADLTASDHLTRRLGHVVTGLFKRAWYQLAAADVASVIDIERSNPRHVAAFREFSDALALLLPLSAEAMPDYDALNKHLVGMRLHLSDAPNSEIYSASFEESPFQLAWSSFGIAKACTQTWEALNTAPLAESFAAELEQTRVRAHAALMERQHPVLRDCHDNSISTVSQPGPSSVQLDATPVFPVLMEAVASQTLSIGAADVTESDAHSVEITSPFHSVQFISIPCSISPVPSVEAAPTPSADIPIGDCHESDADIASSLVPSTLISVSSTCPEPDLETSKSELPQPKPEPEPTKPLLDPNELLPEFGPLPVSVVPVVSARAGPIPTSSKPEVEEGEIEVPIRSVVIPDRSHSHRSRHHEAPRTDSSHATRVPNSSSTSATRPRSPVLNPHRPLNSRSDFYYERRPERPVYSEEPERYERQSDERLVYHPAHASQHHHTPEHHSRRSSHSQPPPHHSPHDHEFHPHHSHQDYFYYADRDRSPHRSSSRNHTSRHPAPSIWDRFFLSRNSTHNFAHTSAHSSAHAPAHTYIHTSPPSASRRRHHSEMAGQPIVQRISRQYSPSSQPPSNCISDRWRSQDADYHRSESNEAHLHSEDHESTSTGVSPHRSITISRPESKR